MKFYGAVALSFIVDDLDTYAIWLAKNLGYNKILGRFDDYFLEQKWKNLILINPNGGLPLVLKQSLKWNYLKIKKIDITNLGILAFKLYAGNIKKTFLYAKVKKIPLSSGLLLDPFEKFCFWKKDSMGIPFVFTETNFTPFNPSNSAGIYGVIWSVRDIDFATEFFIKLGYKIVFHDEGIFQDLKPIGGDKYEIKRVILNANHKTPFSEFIKTTQVDLVSIKNFNYPENQKLFDIFSLIILAQNSHQKISYFFPQLQAIDNDIITAIRGYWKDRDLKVFYIEPFVIKPTKLTKFNLKLDTKQFSKAQLKHIFSLLKEI